MKMDYTKKIVDLPAGETAVNHAATCPPLLTIKDADELMSRIVEMFLIQNPEWRVYMAFLSVSCEARVLVAPPAPKDSTETKRKAQRERAKALRPTKGAPDAKPE